MKSNKFLKKLIVAVLSLGILLPAGVSENHNFAQAVTNGWHKNGSDWYYYMGGKPLKNQWYNDYYLKSDGKMARNEWIFDKSYNAWYRLGNDGKYLRNAWYKDYYLKSNGKMAHNEWIFDGFGWYYIGPDGKRARSEWVVGPDGKYVK